jgi:hypothetical protein
VLEDGAVALPEDVPEIFGGGPARRIVLAHVAQAAGELGDALAVGRLPFPSHRQVGRLEELGTADEGDAGLAKDVHGRPNQG